MCLTDIQTSKSLANMFISLDFRMKSYLNACFLWDSPIEILRELGDHLKSRSFSGFTVLIRNVLSEMLLFISFIICHLAYFNQLKIINVLFVIRDVLIHCFPSRYQFRYLNTGYWPIQSTEPISECISVETNVYTTNTV